MGIFKIQKFDEISSFFFGFFEDRQPAFNKSQ